MQELIECKGCGRGYYQNQLCNTMGHMLCHDCVSELVEKLADRSFVGGLYRDSVSLGESRRMRMESARAYAGSEVEVG